MLVVAKRRSVAAKLGRAFQTRSVRKIYWALVHGVPKPPQGKIDAALVKAPDSFLLKVQGDSMIDEGVHDGDLVVVRAARHDAANHVAQLDQPGARDGLEVLARLGGREIAAMAGAIAAAIGVAHRIAAVRGIHIQCLAPFFVSIISRLLSLSGAPS